MNKQQKLLLKTGLSLRELNQMLIYNYHYQRFYDFKLRKISYQKLEEMAIEEEEWL